MDQETNPLVGSRWLLALGSIIIGGVTLYGVFDSPGELIRQDVRLGPVIAATKIIVPIFLTLGILYFLASVKVCKRCGKIIFWRKEEKALDCHDEENASDGSASSEHAHDASVVTTK